MKYGAAKILASITYPALLLCVFIFSLATIFPEMAIWAFIAAPAIVSFLSIYLLGVWYDSSSSRLALAGIASTLAFCLLFPLGQCVHEILLYGTGIITSRYVIGTYIYMFVIFLLPMMATSAMGITAGLVLLSRHGR